MTKAIPLFVIITAAAFLFGACDTTTLPRAIGAGEVLVSEFPSRLLGVGEDAEFGLDVNLPAGSYVIRFGVDGPGLDAEAGIAAAEARPIELTISDDGELTAEEAPVRGGTLRVSGGLTSENGTAIGVARTWALLVTVIDPYTGGAERVVDEVFPYRVQWAE